LTERLVKVVLGEISGVPLATHRIISQRYGAALLMATKRPTAL